MRTVTRPSRGVNLIAFDSRFQTICCSRSASPLISSDAAAISYSSPTPFASAVGRTAARAASTTAPIRTDRKVRLILPRMIRETSRMSSISAVCRCTLRSIVSSAFEDLDSVELSGAQQMNPSHDRVERVAQLVRYGREKFLFHPARGFGFLQRLMFRIDVGGRDDPSAITFPIRRAAELRASGTIGTHRRYAAADEP